MIARAFPLILLLWTFNPLLAQAPSQAPAAASADEGASTSLTTTIPNIFKDQKRIYWDFPRDLAHGKHWIPVAAFVATTAVLSATDQFESPYFRKTTTFHGFNNALSGTNSSLIIAAAPVATYLTGLFRKDHDLQSTAWLTGEAVADSEIAEEVLKLITRRARPESIPPNGNFADTWFDSRSATDGGFPSGHTIAAFSVATVMSQRFGRSHRWVPYVAYGAAGAIGFSRVTLSAHNVSDVFAGAALGYVISRFVVLRRH